MFIARQISNAQVNFLLEFIMLIWLGCVIGYLGWSFVVVTDATTKLILGASDLFKSFLFVKLANRIRKESCLSRNAPNTG